MAARRRTYLMCEPRYFEVKYAINAWMDTSVEVDVELAAKQWRCLKDCYEQLGHQVELIEPVEGLPDMVFAANSAFSVDGAVFGARFRHPERAGEAIAHASWYAERGWQQFVSGIHVNEGEGDFTYVDGPQLILGGYGFRTEPAAHAEAQDALGRPVIGLHLTDPRFYHLDVALFVLDDNNVCYYPHAFSKGSQQVLQHLFPNAVIADEADALAFGLNAVSDGHNVVMPEQAEGLIEKISAAGFNTVTVDVSEFRKAGGSVKCCTAELRS